MGLSKSSGNSQFKAAPVNREIARDWHPVDNKKVNAKTNKTIFFMM